ncbi:hypothetical protein BXS46_20570 [Salmonella enterica subsp. enterica serovar Infantis]|nr:hypothetical protein [Salmonella enterica subsp. enterica serovar Infantis]EIC4908532.1 hypothetical protein [Salmonella enterica]EIC6911809.1 hypothetical protein [Salmonella enterica subsp. enterica serovar Infantis]
MKIEENENCFEVEVSVELLEDDTPVIMFTSEKSEFGFDVAQAKTAVIALQHFIETGELPE